MKLRLVVAGDPSFAGVPGSPRGRDKRQQPQRELWMAGARAQADQLAAAKTLRRLCFSLAAVAAIASPVLGQTMQHAGEVKSAQFSPDGRWVVTASKDYTNTAIPCSANRTATPTAWPVVASHSRA
jgi:hypothetical protein